MQDAQVTKSLPEYCLTQPLLWTIIFLHFNSYLKRRRMWKFVLFTSCQRVYWCVRDDSQLCLVCVHSLITCLQLKKMSLTNEFAHDAITFVITCTWHEFYHNTQPETILNICTRYIFRRVLGKTSAILRSCKMKKINLEVTYKRYRFCYWNSCKCLPNFVNVAALYVR